MVIPSLLNLFIQYNCLRGIFHEDEEFFSQTLSNTLEVIDQQEGLDISSLRFGTDEVSAALLVNSQPYPQTREFYDADFLVLIGNSDDERSLEVFLVGIETGRAVSFEKRLDEINNENLSSVINELILKGLKKAQDLLKFSADKIVDPVASVVQYQLPNKTPKDLAINFDYDAPLETINKFAFVLGDLELSRDGSLHYELKTTSYYTINVEFTVKNKTIQAVFIDTDFRPESRQQQVVYPMIVLSRKGYPVEFVFKFEDERITGVDIHPAKNPYLPHKLN